MHELLAHLVGDYVLQNHWMANTKTRSWLAAAVHAALYTLPFLLLTQDWRALAIIGGTHAVIDRYRLAGYWIRFWGVGVEGHVIGWAMARRGYFRRMVTPDAPPFLAVWLLILVDNTMHLCINHAVLALAGV